MTHCPPELGQLATMIRNSLVVTLNQLFQSAKPPLDPMISDNSSNNWDECM